MIKFFRKIRQNLLSEGKTGKYLKYALGEIVLVVIGILIAVQINNQNEFRKQKLIELDLLEGIRNDILKDTVDLNYNIRAYKYVVKYDSITINHLINKTGFEKVLIDDINYSVYSDWNIILHNSRFQEAKSKGLSIISNSILREQINNLYEFQYRFLSMVENESETYNDSKKLLNSIGKYLSVDSTGVTMSIESFNKLVEDDNSIFLLNNARENRKFLLRIHLETLESCLKVANNIKNEIDTLKE